MRRKLIAGAGVLALIAVPTAFAAGGGGPIRGAERNPSPDRTTEYHHETQIIGNVAGTSANVGGYVTRQSNKSDTGGGAIYGCRAGSGHEACVAANNLADGDAFRFQASPTASRAGVIRFGTSLGKPVSKPPFATNGTGRVDNLNADMVDGRDAPLTASVPAGGSPEGAKGFGAARVGTGVYNAVVPDNEVSGIPCTPQATIDGAEPALVTVQPSPGASSLPVYIVHTFDLDGTPADHAFFLTLQC